MKMIENIVTLFRECKDNFQIRHKMIKGILLIDMIDPWNKFELCLKPVSKYISEQLTRPFAVLVLEIKDFPKACDNSNGQIFKFT